MTTCIRRPESVWTQCKCDDCRPRKRRIGKIHHHGYYRRVSSEAAWAVLEPRLADNWSATAITSAAGLDPDRLTGAIAAFRRDGHRTQLGPYVSDRIVNMGRPAIGSVGSRWTVLRLQALARIGWGLRSLSEETGINFSTLSMVRAGHTERVKAVTANAVADAYARLQHTPGANEQARRCAALAEWPGPYHYDDDFWEVP